MISELAGFGSMEEGLEMLDLMESLDFKVGASSWNSVIAACVRSGDVELAMRVLWQMVESVRPDSAMFNIVMSVTKRLSLDWLKKLHGFVVRNLGVVCTNRVDEERL